MRYLSIDVETTGLDPSWCQTLEVAAVLADTLDFTTNVEDLPTFKCRFYYDKVVGEPYALHLNAELIRDMDARPAIHNYLHPDKFWSEFTWWIECQIGLHCKDNKLSLSGKNYGMFDSRFLERLPRWDRRHMHHRLLDPGQFFFLPEDKVLPDLKTCIERSGLIYDLKKHHKAVEDARFVVELNRRGLTNQWRHLTLPVLPPFTPFREYKKQ